VQARGGDGAPGVARPGRAHEARERIRVVAGRSRRRRR
jgi:hypothetical protein